jgi:hypothetical protein
MKMKTLLACLAVIALQGCFTYPKTADEFKEGVRQGRGTSRIWTWDIDRKFSDVYNSVKAGSDACFNFDKSWVMMSGGGMTGSVPNVGISETQMTGPNKGETVFKANGTHQAVIEMLGTSKNTTKVIVYGVSMGSYPRDIASIESWARGQGTKCL